MDTSKQKPVMLRLIASAVSVATRAGEEVKRITKTGELGLVDKGGRDYQTEADRTAQRMIVTSLTRQYPKCKIVGEEDLEEDKESDDKLEVSTLEQSVLEQTLPEQYTQLKEEDITIWVDPLDGTTEFVKGFLEHVTVLIGISVAGRSVAGIIHQPYYQYAQFGSEAPGRTMWGLVGLGCFGVEPKVLPTDKLIITTTASHGNRNIEATLAVLKPDQVLKVGGAGHKVMLVIEGRAHSYVFSSYGCKRWDTSAPEAVLEAAGGKLTDVYGNRIDYQHRSDNNYQNYLGVIASCNEAVHKRVIENIPEDVKLRLTETQNKSMHSKS